MSADPNESNDSNNNNNMDTNDATEDINMQEKIQSKFEQRLGPDGSLWNALDNFAPGIGSILSAVVDPTNHAYHQTTQSTVRNSIDNNNSNNSSNLDNLASGDAQNSQLVSNISENDEKSQLQNNANVSIGGTGGTGGTAGMSNHRFGFDENGSLHTFNFVNFGANRSADSNVEQKDHVDEAIMQRLQEKAAKRAAKEEKRKMKRENQNFSNNNSATTYTHRYRYINSERGINTDWDPYASRMRPNHVQNNPTRNSNDPVVNPSSNDS